MEIKCYPVDYLKYCNMSLKQPNILVHYGVSIKNGAPGIGTGNWKRSGNVKIDNAASYNLNKFGKSSKTNVLYIMGSSGSGKSTLAKQIKDEKTDVINLDSYFGVTDIKDISNKNFDEFLKKKKFDSKRLHASNRKKNLNDWINALENFEKYIDEFGNDQYKRNRKVICEGFQLLDETLRPDKTYFKDKPTILMTTPPDISSKRSKERDNNKNFVDVAWQYEMTLGIKHILDN